MREVVRTMRTRHGHAKGNGKVVDTSEYRSWRAMLSRCSDPKNIGFSNYGGRGITVCERWRESFAAFLADMGTKSSPDLTIDRIDNDGNYEPVNCRWATRAEQAQNKTRRPLFRPDAMDIARGFARARKERRT